MLFLYLESQKKFSSVSFSWGWPKYYQLQVAFKMFYFMHMIINILSICFKDIISGGFYDAKNDCVNFECNIEIKSVDKTNTLILPEIK